MCGIKNFTTPIEYIAEKCLYIITVIIRRAIKTEFNDLAVATDFKINKYLPSKLIISFVSRLPLYVCVTYD